MPKSYALLFSLLGVCALIGIGAALSYRNVWIALGLAIAYVFIVGAGFIVKAKMSRRSK